MRQPLTNLERGEALRWPEERWRELQAGKLREHLRHAATSPLYGSKQLPGDVQISTGTMTTNLAQLPFTTKDELAAAGRAAMAVKVEDVREWVCTSGTAGKPLDVPLTASDLERLAENEAVALGIAGVSAGDVVLIAVGMERLFVAGLAYWLGAQRLGAACIRIGPQLGVQPSFIAQMLTRAGPARRTFIIAVPTLLKTVDAPREEMTGIIAIGEPTRAQDLTQHALARQLGERFGCAIMSTYATTETCSTFAEGPECRGGHLNPALAVVEIVDEHGVPVPDEVTGEVVVTPLGVEGMPLVRFRTGDIAALYRSACPCGRTTPRLGPILGRRHQLLKVSGTSVYAMAIVESLHAIGEVANFVVVAEQSGELADLVTLFLHLKADSRDVRAAVERSVRSSLRVTPEIRYVSGEQVCELQGAAPGRKARYFIDRRPATPRGF